MVDKPFLFIMVVDGDIVALGRIKDPYWYKLLLHVVAR